MHNFEKRFQQAFKNLKDWPTGTRFLVAVSGGADSVALLHLLDILARNENWQLIVAHLDHGLRAESGQDAEFVSQLATSLGWSCVTQQVNLSKELGPQQGGLEEAARRVRRNFLEKTATNKSCQAIVMAHHKDDQAETFLMRLLRGSGTRGLAGMRSYAPPYLRPFLQFSKSEILAYLEERSLRWREDLSNKDLRFTRNRIRHELLPLLSSFNPNIGTRLLHLCEQLAEDETYWQKFVVAELEKFGKRGDTGYSLPIDYLRCLPLAISNRLLREAINLVRGDLRRINARHIEMVQALIASKHPQGEVHLPGVWVGRRYDLICFAGHAPKLKVWQPMEIFGPGTYPLPDGRELIVRLVSHAITETSCSVVFPLSQIMFPLTIRTIKPGDRFRPEGMQGTRKLQDFFVDQKLTREERATKPLLTCGDEILWVVGLRRNAKQSHAQINGGKFVQINVL